MGGESALHSHQTERHKEGGSLHNSWVSGLRNLKDELVSN